MLGYFGYGQLSWHMQLMFFWAALIGYRNTLEWQQKGLFKFLWEDDYRGKIVIAQGLAVLFFIAAATILLSVIYGIAGMLSGVSHPLILEGVLSVVLHYGLGMFFCAGVGLFTGRHFTSRWGYLVPLLLTFLLGPMGFSFLLGVTRVIPAGFIKTVFGFLELGIHNDNLPFVSLYGFALERTLWLQAAARITLTLFLFFLPLYSIGKKALGIGLLCLTLGFFLLQNSPEGYLHQSVWQEMHNARPIVMRYLATESEPIPPPNGTFKKVRARVSTQQYLDVGIDALWEMSSTSNSIALNLYRELKITSLRVNGREVAYEQKNDTVLIDLPESAAAGEQLSVEMQYDGITPNLYFSSRKASFLPSFFNWLPQPALSQSFGVEERLLALPIYDKLPITYEVEWADEKGVSIVQGEKNYGVTLLSGHYQTTESEGIRYYVAEPMEAGALIETTKYLLPVIEDMYTFFSTNRLPIKTVIGNVYSPASIGFETVHVRISGSTLFANAEFRISDTSSILQHGVRTEDEKGVVRNALSAILLDEERFLRQDNEMEEAFAQAFLYWKYRSPVEDQQLADFIDHAQDPEGLLRAWYTLMLSERTVEWDDINRLVQ